MIGSFVDNPPRHDWPKLVKRPSLDYSSLEGVVREIFDAIEAEGDTALRTYNKKFDGYSGEVLLVSEDEMESAKEKLSTDLVEAIQKAYENIYTFHKHQRVQEPRIETTQGLSCWRVSRPIDRVGLYIPGGTAPLFSTVLMLGVPARIAECSNVTLASKPNAQGEIHPAILFAAKLCGIKTVLKAGGVQAIAAMAVGTQTLEKCFKLFGPGNAYVAAAKQYAQTQGTAIDLPAGPSEVLIVADEHANPAFVAADLLSQAEHGPDSQVVLLSTTHTLIKEVNEELLKQTATLQRKSALTETLKNSLALRFETLDQCIAFSNAYAPEHLILAVQNPDTYFDAICSAGSVFVGKWSSESFGDYASGTNHTLPTAGFAAAYSGVSVDSFVKKISFQEVSESGVRNLGNVVEIMAEAEGLDAHKRAVSIRKEALNNP